MSHGITVVSSVILGVLLSSCGFNRDEPTDQGSTHAISELCNAPKGFFVNEWGVFETVEIGGMVTKDPGKQIGLGASCSYSTPNGFSASIGLHKDLEYPPSSTTPSAAPVSKERKDPRVINIGDDVVAVSNSDFYPDLATTIEGWDASMSMSIPMPASGKVFDREPPSDAQITAAAELLVRTARVLKGS